MKFGIGVLVLILTVLISGCKDSPPQICKPISLQYVNDSISFSYDDDGRLSLSVYYVVGRKIKADEFVYNSAGQLAMLRKIEFPAIGVSHTDMIYSITYDDSNRPLKLTGHTAFSDDIITDFVHDDQSRLIKATTTSNPASPKFIGATRYEYNDDSNVAKVYYSIAINGVVTEVLARENLTFDNVSKYYDGVEAMKVCNEYIYGYAPNRNNTLTAKIYYYNYTKHFIDPPSITFEPTYNEKGRITSLLDDPPGNQPYSGEIIFARLIYSCTP